MISAFGVEHSEISKTYVGGGVYRSVTSLSPKARKVIRTKISNNKDVNNELRLMSGFLPKRVTGNRPYTQAVGRSKLDRDIRSIRDYSKTNAATVTRPYDAIPMKPTSIKGLHVNADATPEQTSQVVRAATRFTQGKKKLKRPVSIKFITEENAILPKGKRGVQRPGAPGVPQRVGVRTNSGRLTIEHELAHSQTKRKHGFQYRSRPNRSTAREEARADVLSGMDRRELPGTSPDYTKMFNKLRAKGIGPSD